MGEGLRRDSRRQGTAAKLQRRILDVLSRTETAAMEDAAALERDKLIVRTLADTGIRLGKLLKLTPDDLLSGQ